MEADLPPGFEVSDAMVAGIKFEEAWNQWLDVHLEADSPIAEELSLLISLGLTVSNLRRVARGFHENYVDLQEGSFAAPEPPQWTAGQNIGGRVERGGAPTASFPRKERATAFSNISSSWALRCVPLPNKRLELTSIFRP